MSYFDHLFILLNRLSTIAPEDGDNEGGEGKGDGAERVECEDNVELGREEGEDDDNDDDDVVEQGEGRSSR